MKSCYPFAFHVISLRSVRRKWEEQNKKCEVRSQFNVVTEELKNINSFPRT